MTAFWIISPLLCVLIRIYLQKENSRREAIIEEKGDYESDEPKLNLETEGTILQVNERDLDLTDRQNKKFLYPL